MRHRKHHIVLDRTAAGRRALLRNLAVSLILYEKISTTEAKARALRPIVERLISVGKTNTLTNRRQLLSGLPVAGAARKVLEVLGPRYRERRGGYLRITRLRARAGDRAKTVRVEFV